MHTSSTDVVYFKQRIEQKISHTYLRRFIEKPTIDEEKLFILISIMDRAILSPGMKEQYIVTTMLVQLALDTHDLVPPESSNDTKDSSQIVKQLTVLAGDYYSGLYYFLLSEIDDYAMIRTLASAIKEINEYKMNLYYQRLNSMDECVYTIKKTEALLFSHVLSHLGLQPLDDTIEEWLLINKLTLELKKLDKYNTSPILDMWLSHCRHSDVYIQRTLKDMVDTQTSQLKEMVASQTLNQGPSMIKELLYEYNTSDVEEG